MHLVSLVVSQYIHIHILHICAYKHIHSHVYLATICQIHELEKSLGDYVMENFIVIYEI